MIFVNSQSFQRKHVCKFSGSASCRRLFTHTHRAQLAAQPGVAAPGWRVQAGPCRAELGRARLGQARPAGPGRPGQAGEAGQAEGGAPRRAVRAPICRISMCTPPWRSPPAPPPFFLGGYYRISTPLGGVRGGCSSYGVSVEVCLI